MTDATDLLTIAVRLLTDAQPNARNDELRKTWRRERDQLYRAFDELRGGGDVDRVELPPLDWSTMPSCDECSLPAVECIKRARTSGHDYRPHHPTPADVLRTIRQHYPSHDAADVPVNNGTPAVARLVDEWEQRILRDAGTLVDVPIDGSLL